MTQAIVAVGAVAGDGTGDKGQVPWNKFNANSTELYSKANFFGIDSGVANAYVVALASLQPQPAAAPTLVAGITVSFIPVNASTVASTLNFAGTGAIAIVDQTGAALDGGELLTTSFTTVKYTGTAWQIVLTNTPALIEGLLSTALLAPFLNLQQTPAELAAGVTPVNLAYPPGNPWRYGADGAGGAADIAALASASQILVTTGVNGWRNGAPIAGNLRTVAEVNANILPTNYSYGTQPYDLRRYGQKSDNATDDTAALNKGLLVGTQTVAGALGSAVAVPVGNSILSSLVPLPNRVRVLGVNKRGSYFLASGAWAVGNGVAAYNASTTYGSTTGTALVLVTSGGILYASRQAGNLNNTPASSPTFWTPISNAMMYAQNGYQAGGIGNSMFDSTLENCSIDANNLAGVGCVLSSAWQEDCGLRGVMLINFDTYGVRFQDAFGGASLSKIVDCELFRGTLAAGGIGIDLTSPMGAVAAFMLDVSNTSITGGTNLLTTGIACTGNSLLCRSVHFENCTNGILIDGSGFISLDDVTGGAGSAQVTNLVTIAATFTGTLIMKNCRRNGSTNFLNDLRVGGYGLIGAVDHPFFVINAGGSTSGAAKGLPFASAWCVFDGTVAGTNAPIAGYNVTSVNRTAVGRWTINLTRGMLSANAAVAPMGNIANATWTKSLASAGSVNIAMNVAGAATDSNEVTVVVFGG